MIKKESVLPNPVESVYSLYIKRLLDIVLSSLALLILVPVFLIVAILEILFHGPPIIYKTRRPGKDGKIFCLYKFRSMTNQRGNDGLLLPESERITKFGLFLRKTSIDELPELINIIKGDMSIIGPRPLLVEYLDYYSPRHAMRHTVRPGLACVRIQRKGTTETWTWRDQFENDIYYIEHISFGTDVKMLFAVLREAFVGASYRAEARRMPFIGVNLDDTRLKNASYVPCHFESLEK